MQLIKLGMSMKDAGKVLNKHYSPEEIVIENDKGKTSWLVAGVKLHFSRKKNLKWISKIGV